MSVLTADQIEQDIDEACRQELAKSGDVYQAGRWRRIGGEPRLVAYIADKYVFKLLIYHAHGCVEYVPKGWKPDEHAPVVALRVHGGHAYFYTGEWSRETAGHPTQRGGTVPANTTEAAV